MRPQAVLHSPAFKALWDRMLTELQDRTQLTRRSIARILCESGRLDDFRRNPQEFIERTAETLNRCKRLAWWTASNTSGWGTSSIMRRNCSRAKN